MTNYASMMALIRDRLRSGISDGAMLRGIHGNRPGKPPIGHDWQPLSRGWPTARWNVRAMRLDRTASGIILQ